MEQVSSRGKEGNGGVVTGRMMRVRLLAVLLLLVLPSLVVAEQARPGWSRSEPTRSSRRPVGQERSAWIPAGGARPGASHAASPHARKSAESSAAVNVNTADVATLLALKGVGEKKARAIMTFRKSHGPFATLEDFDEVPGIGPALIEANRDRIRFR